MVSPSATPGPSSPAYHNNNSGSPQFNDNEQTTSRFSSPSIDTLKRTNHRSKRRTLNLVNPASKSQCAMPKYRSGVGGGIASGKQCPNQSWYVDAQMPMISQLHSRSQSNTLVLPKPAMNKTRIGALRRHPCYLLDSCARQHLLIRYKESDSLFLLEERSCRRLVEVVLASTESEGF